jgi:V8-like Glu-specific endopeptidase
MRGPRASTALCALLTIAGLASLDGVAVAASDHVAVPDRALPKIAHRTGPYSIGGLPSSGRLARSTYNAQDHNLPWDATGYGRSSSAFPAIGRLRFVKPNGNSATCTATVVAKALLLTAGHCVRDGDTGAWNHKFQFTPRLYASSKPYGIFNAKTSYTTHAWGNPSAPHFSPRDFAFVRIYPNAAGHDVSEYTGAYAIGINAPLYQRVLHIGYASEGGFDGCTSVICYPWYCDSRIQVTHKYVSPIDTGYNVGFSCVTTGGASGGPVFQVVSGSSQITSVLSHSGPSKPVTDPTTGKSHRESNTAYGPRFSSRIASLFSYATSH